MSQGLEAARARAEAFVTALGRGQYLQAACCLDPRSFWWFGLPLRPSVWARHARRTFRGKRLGVTPVGAMGARLRAHLDKDRLRRSLVLPLSRRDGAYLFDVSRGRMRVTIGIVADAARVKRVFDPTPLGARGAGS